jgi:plasmid stability protein
MNKLIRNIPDEVVKVLKEQAKAKGLTLEAYMRLILIEQAKSTPHEEKKSGGRDHAY